MCKACALDAENTFYWRTHNGAEMDVVFTYAGKRLGCDIKFTDAPKMTASLRQAPHDLQLDHCYVLHAGEQAPYPLSSSVTAVSLWHLGSHGADVLQAHS